VLETEDIILKSLEELRKIPPRSHSESSQLVQKYFSEIQSLRVEGYSWNKICEFLCQKKIRWQTLRESYLRIEKRKKAEERKRNKIEKPKPEKAISQPIQPLPKPPNRPPNQTINPRQNQTLQPDTDT
jgi:hypothetical protein